MDESALRARTNRLLETGDRELPATSGDLDAERLQASRRSLMSTVDGRRLVYGMVVSDGRAHPFLPVQSDNGQVQTRNVGMYERVRSKLLDVLRESPREFFLMLQEAYERNTNTSGS